jgi:hypothetical protein
MNEKEVAKFFKKWNIVGDMSFKGIDEYNDEGLYECGRPLRRGERIIVKTVLD